VGLIIIWFYFLCQVLNKSVGTAVHLSLHTGDTCVKSIYKKLSASLSAGFLFLIRYAHSQATTPFVKTTAISKVTLTAYPCWCGDGLLFAHRYIVARHCDMAQVYFLDTPFHRPNAKPHLITFRKFVWSRTVS